MHGGASTGPRTQAGLERLHAARTVHGGYGQAARRFQRHAAVIPARGRAIVALSMARAAPAEWAAALGGIAFDSESPGAAVKNASKTPCSVSRDKLSRDSANGMTQRAAAADQRHTPMEAALCSEAVRLRLRQMMPWLVLPARGQAPLIASASILPRRTRRTTENHGGTGPGTVRASAPPVTR